MKNILFLVGFVIMAIMCFCLNSQVSELKTQLANPEHCVSICNDEWEKYINQIGC